MKKIFITLSILFFAMVATFAKDTKLLANDDIRQAIYGAVDKAKVSLQTAKFGKAPIAILPIRNYDSLLGGRMKNMLVNAGFVCIEGKSDPMWDEIIKEIEWDERKDDILDPKTIMKFGKLKAAKILFQCYVRLIDKNPDRIYAEVEMRATEINTGKILWGNTFAHRHYVGEKIHGIVAIDDNLAMLLRKNFALAKQSLNSPAYTEKLKSVKTIAVLPLSGDIAGYITQLTIDMISQSRYLPKQSPIPSLSQARIAARDGLPGSDAFCYGSVRSIHVTGASASVSDKKKTITFTQYVVADIQLSIEEAKTGNILWTAAVRLNEPIVTERAMTNAELKKFRAEKFGNVSDDIKENMVDNWKFYLILGAILVVAIIVIVCITIAIKAFLLYHHVR